MDLLQTPSGKQLTIIPIKHASMILRYENMEIEVDPVIDGTPPTTDYSTFPPADLILFTHDHYDHFDLNAVAQLRKEGTCIIGNSTVGKQLDDAMVMSNGDTTTVGDIKIEAVAAYNITEGHLQFHPKGRDNGYILTINGMRIYIAGDTEDIEELADVGKIDVAFLPCNQPYTMTPKQLRRATEMVRPAILYPYHYGDTDPAAILQAMEGLDVDVRIRNFQ